jgi:hypothetical protein
LPSTFAVGTAGKNFLGIYKKKFHNVDDMEVYKRKPLLMQPQTSQHRKTGLAPDYYYQIYFDGSICLHAGYGKMVVRKTKGARSCEVRNEKR